MKSIGWKIYLALFGIYLISMYIPIPAASYIAAFDYINIPVTLFSIVGLSGLAFNRRILLRKVWVYWFFGAVLWFIVYEYYLRRLMLPAGLQRAGSHIFFIHSVSDLLVYLIPAAFRLPLFAALYIYAFRSDDLWDSAPLKF